jgi:PAS domain S-box-containing protein
MAFWGFGRRIGIRFAAALAILCTIGAISVWSTLRFVAAARDRKASYETRSRLAVLSSHVQDAETGQRGYLITGREQYLAPFTSGSRAIANDLASLARLTSHDSVARRRLSQLEPLIHAKVEELSRTVELRRTGQTARARAIVESDRGQQLMDSIRRFTGIMDRTADSATEVSDASVRAAGNTALVIGAMGTVLAVILVLAALTLLGRNMRSQAAAHEALRIAQARMERVTGSTNAVLYSGAVTDREFIPTWVSDNIKRMMGYDTAEALEPAWWMNNLHPEDRDRVLAAMPTLFHHDELTVEYRFRNKSGVWHWVRDESRLIRRTGGQPLELVGAWLDVTERHRGEEALRHYAAELESANAELDSFAYSVSHDLRAPLRSIDGFSQALLEDNAGQLNDEGHGHIARIRAATKRMGRLIDDLLALARVTRAELERVRVDLSTVAHEIAGDLRSRDPERDVSFTIAPGVAANGDPHLLRIVLENLLGNAWKYTGKRAGAHIEFGTAPYNGAAAYFIRDNGAGFDMAYADKLFGAFQRLHTEAEFQGSGIGLATVQRIIHRHGGKVWAEARVGHGATFYFTL